MRSDAELLAAWAVGDRDAGRELYHRYAQRVSRFFARKTEDDAADLVQRTFLKWLEASRKGAQVGNPAAQLFAIARNELYDAFKRRMSDRERFRPQVTSLADVRTGLSRKLVHREQQRLLALALERLPLDSQLALELYYWEELSMDELAQVLGITRSAAISRVHRARDLLRQRLAELEQSPEIVEETLKGFAPSLPS